MKISQRRGAITVATASFIAVRVSSINAPQSQSHPIYFHNFFSSFYFMFLLVPRLKLVFNLYTRYGDQYVSGNICY